jgi:hypothetical protein
MMSAAASQGGTQRNYMRTALQGILMLAVAAVISCKPSADITGTWKNPEANPQSIRKVMVMTLNGSIEARKIIENSLTSALRQRGYQALSGLETLPRGTAAEVADEEAKATVLDKIKGTETDAILTIALLNDHTEVRYVPGADRYDPVPRFGYLPDFWGYYSDLYPVLNTPAYYQEEKVYFLEVNLYDAKTEQLLWSAQSQTYSPDNLSSVSIDFSAVLVRKMEKDGVINSQ